MKRAITLLLSFSMALSLCTVAFSDGMPQGSSIVTDNGSSAAASVQQTTLRNGDIVYSGTDAYTYVNGNYIPGEENTLPHFKRGSACYAVGGSSDTPLCFEDGSKADLTLGGQIDDPYDLVYHYKGEAVSAQRWSCTSDQIKAGWRYTDENGADVYCVEDQKDGDKLLLAGGTLHLVSVYEPLKGQHILYGKNGLGTEVAVGVYEATCAACGRSIRYQKTNITVDSFCFYTPTSVSSRELAYSLMLPVPAGFTFVEGNIYFIDENYGVAEYEAAATPLEDETDTATGTTLKNGDIVYNGTDAYTYISDDYIPGEENTLPHFKRGSACYAVGGSSDTPLCFEDGSKADLTLGGQIDDPYDLVYHYKGEAVSAQKWSCTSDQIKTGWRYTDENGADVYCVEDRKDGDKLLLANGTLHLVSAYEPVRGQHLLYRTSSTDREVEGLVGVYEAECAACGKLVRYQKTNIADDGILRQELTMNGTQWLDQYQYTAAKPIGTEWVTGSIYVIGVSGTASTAQITPQNGDLVYDARTDGSAAAYRYVCGTYTPGGNNHLPFFEQLDSDGSSTGACFAVGDAGDPCLYAAGAREIGLTLGTAVTQNDLRYQYKADRTVRKQAWTCIHDGLKAGWQYTDADGTVIYCFEDTASGSVRLLAGGTVYTVTVYEPLRGQHMLYSVGGTDHAVSGSSDLYEASCAACGKAIRYRKSNTEDCYQTAILSSEYTELLAKQICAIKPVGTNWISGTLYYTNAAGSGTAVTPPEDAVRWTLSDGTLTITINGDMPDYNAEYPAPWWLERLNIRRIVIQSGTVSIGSHAFSGCTALESIYLPASVTCIHEYAFSGCTALSGIALPSGLTSISSYAFNGCTGLQDVVISCGSTELDSNAFLGCTGLRSVFFSGENEEFSQWKENMLSGGNEALEQAEVHEDFQKGGLSSEGDEPDIRDMQCLYTYLTVDQREGRYQNSPTAFTAAADMNDDSRVDVYDLQQLYELLQK